MKITVSQSKEGWTSIPAKTAVLSLALILTVALASPVLAQNFNMDARIIGMGGSDHANDATGMTENSESYKSIGLPLGLLQLWQHRDAFKPSDKVNFNPLLLIEDLSSPLHITLGRESETQGSKIVTDLVNGKISPDLATYRGFVPKSPLSSQGVFSPDFGKTFRLMQVGKLYQGIYVGAGPYLSAGTTFTIDPVLLNVWNSASATIPGNTTINLLDDTVSQAGISVTGGYRARFATPKGMKTKKATDRDGVYVSANYHYIRGYHYDADGIAVGLDTLSNGMIGPTSDVLVDRIWSKSGTGRALDFGANIVTGPWDFNIGADGVANQIVWDGLVHENIALTDVLNGASFVTTKLAPPGGSVTVKLPVRYSGGTTFRAKKWTARGQVSRGVNGREFHVGGEYHLGIVDVRGGGRYTKDVFNPMGGAGINLTKHFGVDGAVFSSTANAQRDHRTAVALSLRLTR